jgi:hypothetical protein
MYWLGRGHTRALVAGNRVPLPGAQAPPGTDAGFPGPPLILEIKGVKERRSNTTLSSL